MLRRRSGARRPLGGPLRHRPLHRSSRRSLRDRQHPRGRRSPPLCSTRCAPSTPPALRSSPPSATSGRPTPASATTFGCTSRSNPKRPPPLSSPTSTCSAATAPSSPPSINKAICSAAWNAVSPPSISPLSPPSASSAQPFSTSPRHRKASPSPFTSRPPAPRSPRHAATGPPPLRPSPPSSAARISSPKPDPRTGIRDTTPRRTRYNRHSASITGEPLNWRGRVAQLDRASAF